ncbi:MAG: hypothetical protein BMS9Abin05_0998 [Rhodothermia bacterium]|nr:MAG: hypothetical protein BMS9Abin05_0998 [Rhodothermia bacterium]
MEQPSINTLVRLLREWTGENLDVQYEAFGADALMRGEKHRFLVEYKDRADAASIRRAIDTLRLAHDSDFVSVVAVPYMGAVGQRICKEEEVSWIDLSGNADIQAHQLRILIEGKPNRFKAQSKLSNVFAPKSSRVSRLLLQYPLSPVRQVEICERVNLSRSFVSQIVSRMVNQGLVRKLSDGSILCDNPQLLFDAWDERYEFKKHNIVRAHVAARSGSELMGTIRDRLLESSLKHAFTGLPAAWAYTRFGSFRLVSVYVPHRFEPEALSDMGIRIEGKGANIWFVKPNDEGIFHGSVEEAAYRCVHPVQLSLDLKHHPERAEEARSQLRSMLFRDRGYEAGIQTS